MNMKLAKFHPYTILSVRKISKQSKRSAVDLAYRVYGPSVAEADKHIMVLHGLLGCKRNWHVISEMIIAKFKVCVIAADARNHGDSPHTVTHSYMEMSEDVQQLMKKLNIQRPHVIGHSMGGRTAMTLALSEPSKVASLVVVDISPVSSEALKTNFFPRLFKIMKTVNFEGANSLDEAKNIATKTILATKIIRRADGIVTNIREVDNNKFRWKYNLKVLKKDFDNIVNFPTEVLNKQYKSPTLFVRGGKSKYVPKEDEPGIKRLFPKAELITIPNAGHSIHDHEPEAFFKVLHKFLANVL